MKPFLLGAGIAILTAVPALADPAPTQTPAQLGASANVSTAAQMPSQEDKAAVRQTGKAEVAANESAPGDARKGGGIITDQELEQKTAIDNGHNDGGAAIPAETAAPAGKQAVKPSRKAKLASNAATKSARKASDGITNQQLQEKKPLDNGHNDGGTAPEQVTP